ncbi:hypothetical protein WJX84_000809 [Apatococcus fuscideae]|uniref:Acetylornithine transaminase n=1 Tax=Apatococcus fuscideae TaxID=2026836 RepID=A0AAW1T247_9CHLO
MRKNSPPQCSHSEVRGLTNPYKTARYAARRQALKTKAVAAPPRPASSPPAQNSSTSAEQTIADEAKYVLQTYARLAKRLVENTPWADRVFYSNSGTEAVEAVIKFARKYARVQAGEDPYSTESNAATEVVCFSGAFHGRTMGALSLTAKEQYKTPFMPIMPGSVTAKYLDLESARQCIKKGKTAAVIVEPLQGEGGIHMSSQAFLEGLRELCDEAGALLIFDEIQCGLGRTGKLWAHEYFGVQPDMMTLAKPLAGGLPIGAVLLKQKIADVMAPGDHGSTFAGNPLVCAAGEAVLDVLLAPGFLQAVHDNGVALRHGLREKLGSNPHVKEVRGLGLISGIQLDVPAGPVVAAALEAGLIVITAGKGDVVRMVPPLIVTQEDVQKCVDILAEVIPQALAAEMPPVS